MFPERMMAKNDRIARSIIVIVSVIVFLAVAALGKIQVPLDRHFDVHLFARLNAVINSCVSILLIAAFIAVRQRKYNLHKKLMITAILLSVLFLISYICHHLFSGDTKYGGIGPIRYFYFFILITHIILAAVILPFILFT